MKPFVRLLSAAALAFPFVAACSSTGSASGSKQAEAAASSLDDLRGALVALKGDVEASSSSLGSLVGSQEDPAQDTKQAYAAFSKSLSTLEASAGKTTRELDGLRKETEAYFAKWTKDSAAITDAGLKKSAEKRQKSMASVLDELGDEMGDVQEELGPFQQLLGEVRTYLGNDLSPAGLEAVRGKAKTLAKQARSLAGQIDDVLEEIDDGAASFRGA